MRRPEGVSRLGYLSAAVLDRASLLASAARRSGQPTEAQAFEPADPAPDGLPWPPARLRGLISESTDPDEFMRVGALKARQIREAVANAGTSIDSLGAILDFGCGCGRVARHWKDLRGPELHGTDYDPELVGWCRDNLPFLKVHQNELEPPTELSAGRFDLVYVISILTHLPEELGRRWLEEWGRVLRPGGLLLFTTHGDVHRRHLSRRERLSYDAGEVVVKNAGVAGSAVCMAHHPRSWVDANLPPGFEVVSFTPGAPTVGFLQDMHVLRRVA